MRRRVPGGKLIHPQPFYSECYDESMSKVKIAFEPFLNGSRTCALQHLLLEVEEGKVIGEILTPFNVEGRSITYADRIG